MENNFSVAQPEDCITEFKELLSELIDLEPSDSLEEALSNLMEYESVSAVQAVMIIGYAVKHFLTGKLKVMKGYVYYHGVNFEEFICSLSITELHYIGQLMTKEESKQIWLKNLKHQSTKYMNGEV